MLPEPARLLGAKSKNDEKPKAEIKPDPSKSQGARVLATYSIPLGANEATLTFNGEVLTAEDFDALAEFVEFAKKQFVRKARTAITNSTRFATHKIPASELPEDKS